MDSAVARQMESAARTIADERLLEQELARHHDQSAALHERAREAVGRNDEGAARVCLSRRREQEKLIAALADQLARAHATGERLRRELDAMRVRRSEAARTLQTLIARERSAATKRQFATVPAGGSAESSGFARFDRLRQVVERHEAEADALVELGEFADPVQELDPQTDAGIEAELQALKAGHG
jgi:phage shock protein A